MTKILIVDDSSLSRRLMCRILEPEGYEIIEADNGQAALEFYRLHRPDLVIMDLVMPGMHGLELLRQLRQFDPLARVVVASSDVQRFSQEQAKELGARAFVDKPLAAERVLPAVRQALEGGHKKLTEHQQDGLTEFMNIGMGRAAASLSDLTNQPLALEVPYLAVCPLRELPGLFMELLPAEAVVTHMAFQGPITGDCLLMSDLSAAISLGDLLMALRPPEGRPDSSDYEVMNEITNICYNGILGVLSNLLRVNINFGVPRTQVEAPAKTLEAVAHRHQVELYALVVSTHLLLQSSAINIHLVLSLTTDSMERLLDAVEQEELLIAERERTHDHS